MEKKTSKLLMEYKKFYLSLIPQHYSLTLFISA